MWSLYIKRLYSISLTIKPINHFFMKRTLLSVLTLALLGAAQAQTRNTLLMKPGPDCGIDAVVAINNTAALNWQNTNYGANPQMYAIAWTFFANGGTEGYFRSLIDFRDLDLVPQNANVVSATLRLYGVPTSPHTPGNSGANISWVQQVTSAWTEFGVTWNTQPTVTPVNQVAIPASTSVWNYNVAVNVTAMVQAMVNQPAANRFGFRIMLQTEAIYRSLLFASSDHATPALWPELEVTYEYQCAQSSQPPASITAIPDMVQTDDVDNDETLSVFPNPATGMVTLNFNGGIESGAIVSVTNSLGQTVKQASFTTVKGTNRHQMDLSGLATGNYSVNIRFTNPAVAPMFKKIVVK